MLMMTLHAGTWLHLHPFDQLESPVTLLYGLGLKLHRESALALP